MRMYGTARWQELCRFADPQLARSVATSIESMEFEVRLAAGSGQTVQERAETAGLAQPLYVLEVDHGDWETLADVLDEIVNEQLEFDRLFEMRHTRHSRQRIFIIITLTGVVEVLAILGLIEL